MAIKSFGFGRKSAKGPRMHPNPIYRTTPEDKALAAALDRGFGTLTAFTDEGLQAAHIPFALNEEVLELHLMRANPLAKASPIPALLAVSLGDAYVSPDWYGMAIRCPPGSMALSISTALCAPYPQKSLRLF